MLEPHFAGAVVISIVFLVIAVQVLRLARLALVQRAMRRVLDAGDQIAPEILAQALDRSSGPMGLIEVRNGLVLVAIGLATAVFGLIQAQEATIRLAVGIAAFPGLVGAAMLIFGLVMLRRQRA
jgi:hypothetical protein